jgi:type I restriction enzyme S subunit
LPEEWEVNTLEDVCAKAINGGTPSTEIEKYWEGDIPWITGADILNQKVSKIRRYITEEAVRDSSTNVIPKGNLLVVTRTGVGKLSIAPFDVAVSQDFTGIIPNKKINHEFLFWLLNNSRNFFLDLTQGTSINGITRKDLMSYNFPLPPLPEQHRIAEILSTIDETIERTEALIKKYRHIKAGLMSDLLTRGIDEVGRIRSEETHEFKDSPLGRVPEEWEVGTFSDIAYINPKTNISNLSDNSLVTFLSMPDVGENGRILSRQVKRLFEMAKGFTRFAEEDVIFAKITPCMENGKGALATELINKIGFGSTEFHILRAKESGNPEFIYQITRFKKLRLKAEGYMTGSAGQQRVPTDFFQEFQIPLPPLPEQHHIAEILTTIDTYIEKEQTYLNKLQQIKKGLMQDLLTGKVRVIPAPPKPAEAAT